MKLLLHICCAPCLTAPLEILKNMPFAIQGFFYNPNIYPVDEYERRLMALKDYTEFINLPVSYIDYQPNEYLETLSDGTERPRCYYCYYLRLKKTAIFARENGFNLYSTTLLLSPYQRHELIIEIAEAISAEAGIPFFYRDFRASFYRAKDIAREYNIYRQKYCGCVFSQNTNKQQRIKSRQVEYTDNVR
ncbi:MAG: epoxyqueuosine reductase QueH [Candidatus Omnitrophota bacterium]